MNSALEQFESNIQRTRTLAAIHNVLGTRTTSALDTSDILRSALVLAVSALDQYIHEIVRLGILEIYHGRRTHTSSSLKFGVSLRGALQIRVAPEDDSWRDSEIRGHHSWQRFEHPDRIADAIRLILDMSLWDTVASDLGSDTPDVKQRLKLIVDRRNKLTHEADIDPRFPNTHWPIDDQMVFDSITFIEQVVHSIHKAVAGLL